MHLSESSTRPTVPIDHRPAAIQSPLNVAVWKQKLHSHPDQDFAQYVIHGIEWGSRIEVKEILHPCPQPKNMGSALQNKDVVDAYLQDELNDAHSIHINRIGVIPKRHQVGKWPAPYYRPLLPRG